MLQIAHGTHEKLGALLLNEIAPAPIIHRQTAEVLVSEGATVQSRYD